VLPDNYELSLKRLKSLICRLQQDPDILKEYHSVIQDQLRKGIVEMVEESHISESGRVHYLPHHAVIRKDKTTTKVRVVYDASAKGGGPSLNECLHTGPKFEQRILGVLLRFRTYKVVLTADTEKAFLMVSVAKNDRDVLRFLWVVDPTSSDPEVVVLRFTRMTFGVSASPFLLNATVDFHLGKYTTTHPELVEKLKRSIYVDDVLTGSENEQEAYQLYLNSKAILKEGGFNLRKFVSSSKLLQAQIDHKESCFLDVHIHPLHADFMDSQMLPRLPTLRWSTSHLKILTEPPLGLCLPRVV